MTEKNLGEIDERRKQMKGETNRHDLRGAITETNNLPTHQNLFTLIYAFPIYNVNKK